MCLTACKTLVKLNPGVNFISILGAPFLYKSLLRSFSLVRFWLCNFMAQKFCRKSFWPSLFFSFFKLVKILEVFVALPQSMITSSPILKHLSRDLVEQIVILLVHFPSNKKSNKTTISKGLQKFQYFI